MPFFNWRHALYTDAGDKSLCLEHVDFYFSIQPDQDVRLDLFPYEWRL